MLHRFHFQRFFIFPQNNEYYLNGYKLTLKIIVYIGIVVVAAEEPTIHSL